ncbi:LamG-like jellyroll fold domain-containing protein [Celeribacter sp.]|uniref:LamG-like jellyroll fold domain-containing protein n=1 Tax=Celeribacter sp. TaxID=1890673 RepID=UPI003A92A780
MSWYRTGTATVTSGSATVTGSGTNWGGTPVKVGHGFIGPDGEIYEIATVNSSAEITLATPYAGDTASGAAYAIVPTAGVNVELHAAVQALIERANNDLDTLDQWKSDLQTEIDDEFAAALAGYQASIDAAVASIDLAAIAETKNVTAVAGFIYDTSKDSDGGAWRHRCQHTSWYDEVGPFPSLAILILEETAIWIFDGDDPDMPLWMGLPSGPNRFPTNTNMTSISAKNGCVFFGHTSYLGRLNFPLDECGVTNTTGYRPFLGSISERGDAKGYSDAVNSLGLINGYVRDVAMTVLPTAPVDPATGLQVPTIAVATDGGVSIIDGPAGVGTVVDQTYSGLPAVSLSIHDGDVVSFWSNNAVFVSSISAFVADYSGSGMGFHEAHYQGRAYYALPSEKTIPTISGGIPVLRGQCGSRANLVLSKSDGLAFVHEDPDEKGRGMVAYTAADYATGWMVGDIKGAWLADTDASDLVGGTDPDRSHNGNGLTVNGTITRTPVATGAELVAYSGFSASNYLSQPLNPDLDFGTGDFCVMGWVKGATILSTAVILSRGATAATGFHLYKGSTSSTPMIIFRVGGTTLYGVSGIYDDWVHVAAVRKDGVVYVYFNGVVEAQIAAPADVSGAYTTEIGHSTSLGANAFMKGISLIRISATAPSADQIRKIYEDEKHLFAEGAACTLYGASSDVKAIAADPDTGLLHVGTSDGRSVFQGLRRVDNTEDAVTTFIDAKNGMVIEQ